MELREVVFNKKTPTFFSPQFRLIHKELGGKIIKIPTRFAIYRKFISIKPIKSVTIYDENNRHSIPVEQTPDFQIEPEISKLLEKDIKYNKLSAGLSSLIHEYETIGINAAVVNSSRSSMNPLFIPSNGGTPETIIFVRCDENARFDLEGVNINSQEGELRTAKVSLDSLEALSQDPNVHQLSSSIKLKPLNDIAAARTQLNNFRQTVSQNLTGKGVVIGIVDTGIDVSHPSFAGRILSIWDQKIEGHGWELKDYGAVLTGELIGASFDVIGHGTHVAGIAAGRDKKFGGVAPDADLIIVKTDFIDAHVRDGIEFIFTEAKKIGKPAVVNLSLGGHINPHDGTDELSDWINRHTGEGRIVVAAAGNEGNKDIHAAADIVAGTTVEIGFEISQKGEVPPIILFSGWYAAGGNCEISVRPPIGAATEFQPVINEKNSTRDYVIEGMLIMLTTSPASASLNGDHGFELKIQTGSKEIQNGKWQIIIRNVGDSAVKVDIWSAVPHTFNEVKFLDAFVRDDMKIGSPGSALQAITVASFTTKKEWIDVSGKGRIFPNINIDSISDFSSPGPLRKVTYLKPDIAAPGEFIASALSNRSKLSKESALLVNSDFVINSGTSMACPFVTGVVALLLEKNSILTPDKIKQFLQSKGQIMNQIGMPHDINWGYGLVTF